MNNNVKIFVSVLGLLIIGIVATAIIRTKSANGPQTPGKYDAFATCLKDKGFLFYGAFWCPHCQAEKKLFGTSSHLLPYIECSNPDTHQNQLCNDAGIESYPTWKMPDGTIIPTEGYSGVSLETLSAKSGCMLPDASAPDPATVSPGASSSASSSVPEGTPTPANNPEAQ